ncbi:MAG: ComEC/Rec2 family competence protein [Planctomycetota bacterium]
MDPHRPTTLLCAAAFAIATALLTAPCLPAAAALAAAGFLLATATRWRGRQGGLMGLLALVAALPDDGPGPAWPRPGPVAFAGIVDHCRRDAEERTTLVLRGPHGGLPLHCTGALLAAAGDRVRGFGNAVPGAAPELPPTLHASAAGVTVERGPRSIAACVHELRAALEGELRRIAPGDGGAVLTALVLGGDARVPRDVGEAHRATGLSHLLAVSGAHAAMLGWLLGIGGFGRGRRLGAGRGHTAAALVLLLLYGAVTGGEPPVLRAVVMYALGAVALHTGRRLRLAAGLGVPAMLTACLDPAALGGASFQLSYAAVFSLSLCRVDARTAAGRWILAPLSASFWATVATAPVTLWWFGQLAPWTILLTPVLAPLVGALLCLGLAAAVLGTLAPVLAAPFGPVLRALLDLYLGAVAAADALPGTPVRALANPASGVLLAAACAAVLAFALLPLRRAVLAATTVLAAPHFLPLAGATGPRLSVFAVGHGQAALFDDGHGRRVLFDCGSLQHPSLAARKIVGALAQRHIDWAVVTHGDSDHHNGLRAVLQAATIGHALLPAHLREHELVRLLREHGTAVHLLAPGERCEPLPGVVVAAPRVPGGVPQNDTSLWTAIATAGARVLLTGDAEAFGTAAALAQGIAAPCDVLMLPHHGRWNPLAPRLLAAAHPRCCLASAACADGATAIGTAARRGGSELFVTGRDGDLEVDLAAVRVRAAVPWRRIDAR